MIRELQCLANDKENQERMLINVIPGFMWKLELLSKPLLITAQIPM